jgi:phage shock protein PspC (stress-responsive transcriptional regulator)
MALPLVRPSERWVAGVCSGLARRFGISAGKMRLLFVVSCLLPGPQFDRHLALWILTPSEEPGTT